MRILKFIFSQNPHFCCTSSNASIGLYLLFPSFVSRLHCNLSAILPVSCFLFLNWHLTYHSSTQYFDFFLCTSDSFHSYPWRSVIDCILDLFRLFRLLYAQWLYIVFSYVLSIDGTTHFSNRTSSLMNCTSDLSIFCTLDHHMEVIFFSALSVDQCFGAD